MMKSFEREKKGRGIWKVEVRCARARLNGRTIIINVWSTLVSCYDMHRWTNKPLNDPRDDHFESPSGPVF